MRSSLATPQHKVPDTYIDVEFFTQYRQCPSSPIPLKTLIHLPADALHRSAVLSSLREPKLLAAFQFMAARTRFHDLRVAHHQCEQSRLLTGEIVATVFSVVQFDGGHSVRQVYDAYQTFMNNQEISVSETLGVLTICENDAGSDDAGSSQMRFVSTPWEGLEVDSNLVRFETYSDATVDSPDAYALGTSDYVDHDDLYPYQPHRGRKDTTNAWLLVQVPSTTDQRMVAMARWSHTRFRPPLGPLTKEIEAVVTSGMLHWCDLMPKIMADLLATQTPALLVSVTIYL
jgi:hypothetical protein